MNRRLLPVLLAAIALLVVATLGTRYVTGSWAPTSFDGGLTFSETPELIDSGGNRLPDEVVKQFVTICGKLRSTSRDIREDRGDGFVILRRPKARDVDVLTLYPRKSVVFHGWWIDAKTYSMLGQRAPCFELSDELKRFIEGHKLRRSDAEQDGAHQPATRPASQAE
jgi:hypothetical protein